MNKRCFYCWYLGFTEVNGLIGQQYVIDGIYKLTTQSNLFNKNQDSRRKKVASKVTITLNDTSFTLTGSSTAAKAPANQPSKSYTIDYEKISYITRLNDPKYSDIVALIIVNTDDSQNMDDIYQKQRKQHPYRHIANLHAFKFDSADSAKKLEKYLNEYYFAYRQNAQKPVSIAHYNKNINIKNVINNRNAVNVNTNNNNNNNNSNRINHTNQVITVSNKSLNSGGGTNTGSSSNDSEYNNPNLDPFIKNNIKILSEEVMSRLRNSSPERRSSQINPVSPRSTAQAKVAMQPFEDINNEFKKKLFSEQPLLLPPKDYNTVMRSRGDLEKAESRRSSNQNIIGKSAIDLRTTLEKIDENQQANISSTRGDNKLKNESIDDDDMSIDEEAKKALNYYDAIVNSISIQTPLNTSFVSNSHYRFEPPTSSNNGQLTKIRSFSKDSKPVLSSMKPSFDLIETKDNLKMNPLHVTDEEYSKNYFPVNNFKLINQLKMQSKPATIPSGTPPISFQGGFRSNALTKLGNYAPKVLTKTPGYHSTQDIKNSFYLHSNSNNNNNNNKQMQSSNHQFSSSLPADQFKKLIPQKLKSNLASTFEEPEIDYYNTDTLDLHRHSNNNRVKDSQFILIPTQNHQKLLSTKLNNSTPNLVYDQNFTNRPQQQQIQMIDERYADVYY